ncbi:MAG TPA: nucleotidyl transferase AbiEii/AbiGii toxin family protein [Candidatus Binatia bacterium]|jgi:hypothetical protein|nr:nucleotidyl transferase AbiEii/AbiGii toxin family protein [Candidatus Binatia bacterium]
MHNGLQEADNLQRVVAKLIAVSPAGVKLLLIGGFRYRLLDDSQRFSVDIDYHWDGDLGRKQEELLSYCERVVLKEVKRLFGYEGSASKRTGPDAESPNVASVDLRFWKPARVMEIPIDITKIICLDSPTVRTANGTIHATPSDADLIEGKILALFNRPFLQHRDFVDIWLYGDRLRPDSPERVKQKITALGIDPEAVRKSLQDFDEEADYHARAIQEIIETQVDPTAAEQINAGGGGRTVLADSLKFIKRVCP